MKTLNGMNVNDVLPQAIDLLNNEGDPIESRNGSTIEIPEPASITYEHPWERVLLNPIRDPNHFFHMFESLWMLAGRRDVAFLNEFNSNIKNYSDDGIKFNGAYGYRARKHFHIDQIEEIVKTLTLDPNSRQAVIQLWSANDLTKYTKDKCCNMQLVFRVRDNRLFMTVYNRSNDLIWGTLGANVVHLSMIQEYIAAKLGLPMAPYTQVMNSLHVYTDPQSIATGLGAKMWVKLNSKDNQIIMYNDEFLYPYHSFKKLVLMGTKAQSMRLFDYDLNFLFSVYNKFNLEELAEIKHWQSSYFKSLVVPMITTWIQYKSNGAKEALKFAESIKADDWRTGCKQWLTKRVKW